MGLDETTDPARGAAAPTLSPGRAAALKALFEDQIPFHRLLGLRCEALRKGEVRVSLPPRPAHTGDPFRPALHGGVIATLIDVAGGLAVFTEVGADDRVSTIDLRVDYLSPGRCDAPLIAESRLRRVGNRVAMAEITLHHGDPDEPVARGAGVYNVLRRSDPA